MIEIREIGTMYRVSDGHSSMTLSTEELSELHYATRRILSEKRLI